MTLSIEDLARLICETQNVDGFKCTCPAPFEPDWCLGNRAKAQARAVVTALRDEFVTVYRREFLSEASIDTFLAAHVVGMFEEILAERGDEAAGGSTREDEKAVEAVGDKGPVSVNSPAAVPDAACEWAVERGPYYETGCGFGCSTLAGNTLPRSKFFCAQCSRPIKFVEAAR